MTDFQAVVDGAVKKAKGEGKRKDAITEEDLNLPKIGFVAMMMASDPAQTRELAIFEIVATTAFLHVRYPKVNDELTEFVKGLYKELDAAK